MSRGTLLIAVVLTGLVWVGSAAVYPALPDRIPTHWDLQGKVDGYGAKTWGVFLIPGTLVLLLGLFAALPALSPAPFKLDEFRSTYGFIAVIALGMIAYLQVVMLFAVARGHIAITQAIVAGMFVSLALIGNVLGKVQRNLYVGVRVPWTLASERVWNETHRLAGRLMFGASLAGAALAIAGYPLASLSMLAPIVIVPIVFSLIRYKQLERRGEV